MAASAWQRSLSTTIMAAGFVWSCGAPAAKDLGAAKQTGDTARAASAWNPAAWRPPSLAQLPDDDYGRTVRRGFAILTATRDSLPRFVAANLNCTSCHLDQGSRSTAAPLNGVYARYPKYIERAGAVVPLEDRVNYCMTRSLSGWRLPNESREMQDIVAYLAYVSRGVPVGGRMVIETMPKMPALSGDPARGAAVFRNTCERCHGPDGSGVANAPALWGPHSFSIGASMARLERAASFIRHNMPFDKPGTLSDQEAFDVAAFVTSRPRPDLPGKENDWPVGGAPPDVPYDTKDHRGFRPPPVLPRARPAEAVVPAPRPALAAGGR